jgi:hypothetical protein
MSDNRSLLQQLANHAKAWHSTTGISQSMMARAIGMEDSNYSAFLAGKRGIGSEATCYLSKFVALPKSEAIAKFSAPALRSKILCLQERGRARMSLDNIGGDGWVSGQSGTDPNGTDDITSIVGAASENGYDQATVEVLRQCTALHRKAIKAINAVLQKAKPNPQGTTPPTDQRFGR